MTIKVTILFLVLMLVPMSAVSAAVQSHKSKYAGEEKREIKSLSKSDIEELRAGKGWGLAKAAELNGVPGPVHLVALYNKLRGYSSDDPCENVPKGHDPEMWKQHHNCP